MMLPKCRVLLLSSAILAQAIPAASAFSAGTPFQPLPKRHLPLNGSFFHGSWLAGCERKWEEREDELAPHQASGPGLRRRVSLRAAGCGFAALGTWSGMRPWGEKARFSLLLILSVFRSLKGGLYQEGISIIGGLYQEGIAVGRLCGDLSLSLSFSLSRALYLNQHQLAP